MMHLKYRLAALLSLVMLLFLLSAQAEGTWKNVLLLGGDARDTQRYDRSDAMIILSLNRDESLVKMTSVMRDTWVHFPGRKNPGKINAATVYGGPELAMETVNTAFGTDIQDYVLINMAQLKQIVDLLGGVDLELSEKEARQVGCESGFVHLNGEQTLAYCRIRYIDSDYVRVMRQQKVLLSLAKRAQNMEIDELTGVADQILNIVNTSLTDEELDELLTLFMIVDVEEIEQYRIPADGTFRSGLINGIWRIEPNFEENQTLLHEFIYGE